MPAFVGNPSSSLPPAPGSKPNVIGRGRSYSPSSDTMGGGGHGDVVGNGSNRMTNHARRISASRREATSASPSTLRRVRTDECPSSPNPTTTRAVAMRRNKTTGTNRSNKRSSATSTGSGGGTKLSLLQDYRVGHADVQSPIARKASVPNEGSALSPTGYLNTGKTGDANFGLPARKYPKAKPIPGMALDMSLLSDTSESENTALDTSGQSVEEMIQFRVRNPNSIPSAPPPPPPKPVLPESQLMMGRNHRALHAIVETEAEDKRESTTTSLATTNATVNGSEHSISSKGSTSSLALPSGSSQHSHNGPPATTTGAGLLGRGPSCLGDDSVTSFADSMNMDETHPTNNTTAMISTGRLSEISTATSIGHRGSEYSLMSSSVTSTSNDKRISEISAISNASTLTEASDAPINNSLLNAVIVPRQSLPAPRDSASLPPLEQMPTEDSLLLPPPNTNTITPPQSPSRHTLVVPGHQAPKEPQSPRDRHRHSAPASNSNSNSNSNTPQQSKPTSQQDLTKLHPTARLLQAAAKAVQEPPKQRRRARRNTSGDAKKDVERALPGLRRTQTSETNNRDSMEGSGRLRMPRRSRSEELEDNSEMDHSAGNNKHSSPMPPTRGRGAVRRTKSSDGSGGLARMRRAGRRGDGNDEMGESSRRTPLRTKSSDGSIMSARGRVMRRPSDNPATKEKESTAQARKNNFRRSKSSVSSAEVEKEKPTRSLSPSRRPNAHREAQKDGFGAHHPSMFNSSRIKRFNQDDVREMGLSSSNFGGHELSKLMQSHSGGLLYNNNNAK